MATEAQFDILVPTHGNLELTIRCIKALYKRTATPFHLIVVDDSTPDMDEGTDLTPEWFERFRRTHQNLTYIHSFESFTSGNKIVNMALERCETPYLAIVVNSVAVEPEWEIAGLQVIVSSPQIGAVGLKCLSRLTGLIESAGVGTPVDGSTVIDMGRDHPSHRLSKVYECEAVQWALAIVRKEAVQGLLPENLYHGFKGYEDFDCCFSMRELGWKVFYCGLGVGYHDSFATRGSSKPADKERTLENREIFNKRWGYWKDYKKARPEVGEYFPRMKARERLATKGELTYNSRRERIDFSTAKV